MSLYEPIDRWRVPGNLLSRSLQEMEPDGRKGCEGIVLWLGTVHDRTATIEHLIGLAGVGIVKQPLHLRIDADLLNAVALFGEGYGLFLVGQVHSHPGLFVDLSDVDIEYGIAVPFYLSVVAPHYAQDPSTAWSDCGIHVYEPREGFRRLSLQEGRERIDVMTQVSAPFTRIET